MSTVDWTGKGVWAPAEPVELRGSGLFDGPFSWPVMVLRQSALETNLATMARFCTTHGVELAPHGKTPMAPTLFQAQLAAGAWGITVATPNQALVARRLGIPRVFLANELLDPKVARWAAGEVAGGWEFWCYVDSPAGLEVLREARGVGVFVELGYPDGRTGCRDLADAVALARQASTMDGVRLIGVAGFEGLLPSAEAATDFLQAMVRAAEEIAPLCPSPLVLSAGGSRFFDAVVSTFTPAASANGWRVVLRSGCYLTHDHGMYAADSAFVREPSLGTLQPALEVWAQVLSTPEPGLALLGAGKRDVPYDSGLPTVLAVRAASGALRPAPAAHVTLLNDQHAYVRDVDVVPGELVKLGISHPCTAFDKWRVIPVVDDDYQVVDVVTTYF